MNNYNDMEYYLVEGEGGGKGGGSGGGGVETPNTLQNNTIVNILHLLGEGPIQGLATGDGQSIFMNGVSLQGANGSYNFPGATYSISLGTANQAYIPGFANVTSVYAVGTTVLNASPQVYTVQSTLTDAARVTLGLPNGLRSIDTSTGDINGYSVGILVETKPHSSNTWTSNYDVVKYDKTNSNYQWQIYLTRPTLAANALWDIRVTRTTPDDATANVVSVLQFVNVVEVQEIQQSYNTFAVCGLSLNAQQFGSSIPVMSFLVKGVTVAIPSNYNPTTRVYTGSWDGTFTTGFTNNPAWVLYDLLTNAQYGGGVYGITAAQIDKFSFYTAAAFNDVLVPSGITGQTEPRFTFDAVIQKRENLLSTCLQVAGAMNANLLWVNGLLTLNQDRPASPMMPITKYNVIDGIFEYVGIPINQRITAVNVAYQDKINYYYPKISAQSNSAAMNIYGYNAADFAAFGATTEGQAIRAGKWYLYTSLNQTETVKFKMGLNGNYLTVGDVVALYDEDYTGQAGSGRVVSATSNTVTLDQTVTISGNNKLIGVMLPDGITYEYHAITTANGATNKVTIANTWTQTPQLYNDYIIYSAVSPRTFRITDIKAGSERNELEFTALLYSNANYSYVEGNVALPNAVYTAVTSSNISDPTSIVVTERASNIQLGEQIRRGLLITWSPPTYGTANSYTLKYRFNNSQYQAITGIVTQVYDIENLAPGQYDFILQSVSAKGLMSLGNTFSYTISVTGGGSGTSNLAAPTNFTVNGSGNTFSGQDLVMTWKNPVTNNNQNGVLKDFQVYVLSSSNAVLETITVPPVYAGNTANLHYTLALNTKDYGTASRNVYASVFCRDTKYNLSNAAYTVFNNPAPATMSGTVTAATLANYINITLPTDPDFAGVLVWRGTTSGFTVNSASLVYDGKSSQFADLGLVANTTYYYKWAAYDTFGKDYAGAGLNVAGPFSATPISSNTGIAYGTTNPGSGTEGNIFFNTTDGQLYRYHSGSWTTAVPNTALTGLITTTQIGPNAISTAQIQAAAITANQIAAGAVTANALLVNSVTAGAIAAGAVTTNTIAASAVTTNAIAAGAITATKLSILSANGTSIDMSNGTITFNNGSYMKVQGTGFGQNNAFIEWFGPTNANIANCNAAAALSYLTVTGGAYFGGTLSAGKITNSAQTTDTSNTASVVLGNFLTNGNTKTITVSYNLQYNYWSGDDPTVSASGGGSATIYVDRSLDGGNTWTNAIGTLTCTGTVPTVAQFGKGGLTDRATWNGLNGSTSFTDASAATATMKLRGRIGSITLPTISGNNITGGTVFSQTISIVETES